MSNSTLPPLAYGPVGDPDSKDDFEWAQSRMPDGWHVEGQVLPDPRVSFVAFRVPAHTSWWAMATTRDGRSVKAVGYSVGLALADLVRKVPR